MDLWLGRYTNQVLLLCCALLVVVNLLLLPSEWIGLNTREILDPNGNVVGYYPAKTLWDWLELLIAPALLLLVGFVLNRSERRYSDVVEGQRLFENRIIEKFHFQESYLSDYFDQMTELLLDRGLPSSEENDYVRVVARARTLAVLRVADNVCKGVILRFLYEANLIRYKRIGEEPDDLVGAVVDLFKSDLSGINLVCAYLPYVDLDGAIMRNSDLGGAYFKESVLTHVDFQGSNMLMVDLEGANLEGANLSNVVLYSANLSKTYLKDVNLDNSDLTCSNITLAQLLQAKSLHGVKFPKHINPADLGDKLSPRKDENVPEPQP